MASTVAVSTYLHVTCIPCLSVVSSSPVIHSNSWSSVARWNGLRLSRTQVSHSLRYYAKLLRYAGVRLSQQMLTLQPQQSTQR
eukprot:14446-Heterococcus_DN1.PRE.7